MLNKSNSIIQTVTDNPWSIDVKTVEPDIYKQTQEIKDLSLLENTYKESNYNEQSLGKTLANLRPIIEDILAGDSKALERPEFVCLNFKAMKAALQWLNENQEFSMQTKLNLFTEAWRLNFKCKPPTPGEFLTEKYIGPMAESLRDYIRDTFIEAFDPLKPYRTIVLTPFIGAGKSTWTVLANLYISTLYSMMWRPYKYFNLSVSTVFTQVLGAWNMKKASELLLEPFLNILESSPYFKRVRTHYDLVEASGDDLINCLHWTTSTPSAQPLDCNVQLPNGTSIKMGDVKIGDVIKSPTENTSIVTGIPFQGIADCYEIELEDGRKTRCSNKHLWKVSWKKDKNGNKIWKVVNTEFLINHPDYEFEIWEKEDMV